MRTRGKTAIKLGLPLTLLAISSPVLAGTIYVDARASGANNGTSWTDAYRELVPALARAASGDQIWIAAATYTPSVQAVPGDPRSATFALIPGVALYGGFRGGEINLTDRDPTGNATILSGDLAHDDATSGSKTDNAYHVLFLGDIKGLFTLDGLTITSGYADGAATEMDRRGGGICIQATTVGYPSAVFRNCRWKGNFAMYDGGALYAERLRSVLLEDCLFEENSVDSRDTYVSTGGAVCGDNLELTIQRCTFRRNTAGQDGQRHFAWGGAVFSDTKTAISECIFLENHARASGGAISLFGHAFGVIAGCAFERNSANVLGGALSMSFYSTARVRDCTFRENSCLDPTADGGGAILDEVGYLTVTNCDFIGNTSNKGGGLRTHFDEVKVANCRFYDNSATMWGGGVYNRGSNVTMLNCVVVDNKSDYTGGGIANSDSNLTLVNSTVAGNAAAFGAGGIDAFVSNTPPSMGLAVSNCILWGNTGQGGMGEDSQVRATDRPPSVNYTCIQGWTGNLGGSGNIGADPLLVVGDPWGRLQATSPCIDAGDNTLVPNDLADLDGDWDESEPTVWDFEMHPRRVDNPYVVDTGAGGAPVVDMGAHEYAEDCDANGLFDVCDLNCDAVGGACNVAGCGSAEDCDANAIPDQCEPDNDNDGLIDACDPDDDNDGILDDGDGSGSAGDAACSGGEIVGCDDNCAMTHNTGQNDADGDLVGDACDACPGTIPDVAVDAEGCPPLAAADFDRDGDVDQKDYGEFQRCLSGVAVPQDDPACAAARLDADGDVDYSDTVLFINCLSGPDAPVNPDCVG